MRKLVPSRTGPGSNPRSRTGSPFAGWLEGLEERRMLAATPHHKLHDVSPRYSPMVRSTPELRLPLSPTQQQSAVSAAESAAVAQTYSGALNGKIVYTSAGHGWEWNGSGYFTGRGDTWDVEEAFGNQDQMSFFADYVLRAGGTVVPMRPVGHQLKEVVLDNDSPGVSFSGPWTDSVSAVYYDEDYGTDFGGSADAVPYRTAPVSTTGETAVASYRPNIPEAGFYPVYTWALSGTNRTTQLYRINHSGGSAEVRVDHRKVGRGWVYLGTYHFEQGISDNGKVEISNASPTPGFVIADTIRFGNGMGDYVDGPGTTGKPREDEGSRLWLNRAVGVGVSASTAFGTSNVHAPSNMAEWMNTDTNPFGTSVYIGFHSNAGGGGRGAVGLIDADQGTPNQTSLALYTGRQINQDMQALNGTFEHSWSTRTAHTYTAGFGEIDLGANAEMDATIIEVAFHDSQLDAELLRDPKVRDQLGRSTYEATLEYFDNFGGLTAPFSQPQAPQAVRATANAAGDITINWTAPASRTSGPGAATAYRVYTSRNGYGFADPVQVTGTSLTIPAAQLDGNAYYFKVAAVNTGGESPGSVVVGARKNGPFGGGGTNRVLVVNGFDRNERSQNQRQAYGDGRTQPYPYGTPNGYVERVRMRYNNSFDYVAQAGEAIEAYADGGAALGFDSVQNEHVTNGAVNLANYRAVVWLAGEESTANETFSASEQAAVQNFLDRGGRLFVSGAEIGMDLDRDSGATLPTDADRAFYNNFLRADHAGDDGGSYTATGVAGSIFQGISLAFDNGTTFYDVDAPDRLLAVNGSTVAMNYGAPGSGGAATVWAFQNPFADVPGGPRVVNFGFPFEMITSAPTRSAVMARVLNFLQAAVSPTPTSIDLVASNDTGFSSTDNLTNRDNSSASKTLQFVVGGTIAGADVKLYADGSLIGRATGTDGTTTVTTNGQVNIADGARNLRASQQEPTRDASPLSPTLLTVTIDSVGPTADVVDVTPDPRTDGVPSIDVVFSEPVIGFAANDLQLTRDGSPNLLTASQNLTTSDNQTFTLNNLAGVTSQAGNYTLDFAPAFTAPAVDAAGNVMTGVAGTNDAWVNNDALPVVTDVFVNGRGGWSTLFRDYLGSSGLGDARFGYRIPTASQTNELPWTNLNQISVRFSEPVNVSADDLVLRGVNVAQYANLEFVYDAATSTATWTLPLNASFAAEKLLLDLNADAGGVTDANGNALDGEWTNPTAPAEAGADTLPSGNGSAGGDFRFRLNVLPGDVNGTGSILGSDVTQVRNAQGSEPGFGLYTIFKDVNGTGSILGSDVTLVRNRQGIALPEAEPTAPAALASDDAEEPLLP